jgi:hypothetical protein
MGTFLIALDRHRTVVLYIMAYVCMCVCIQCLRAI